MTKKFRTNNSYLQRVNYDLYNYNIFCRITDCVHIHNQ